jgi:hypothetical protein
MSRLTHFQTTSCVGFSGLSAIEWDFPAFGVLSNERGQCEVFSEVLREFEYVLDCFALHLLAEIVFVSGSLMSL